MNERRPGIQSAIGTVQAGSAHRGAAQSRQVLTVNDPTDVAHEDSSSIDQRVYQTRSFSSGNFDDSDIPENILSKEELDELAQNRERLQNSRKQMYQQKNRIPEGVKQRLEILTGIGRLTEDVKVDDVTFSLRSLKPKEHEEVVTALIGIDYQAIVAYEHRAQILARSLYKIDGQNIESVIGSETIEGKISFIKDVLEESLVSFLFEKYQNILTKNKTKFGELGKTEEEVIENVKKS